MTSAQPLLSNKVTQMSSLVLVVNTLRKQQAPSVAAVLVVADVAAVADAAEVVGNNVDCDIHVQASNADDNHVVVLRPDMVV